MHFKEVEDRVRRRLNETTANVFSANLLADCINDAFDAIASDIIAVDADYNVKSTAISYVANQREYSLPFNCLEIKEVVDYDDEDVVFAPIDYNNKSNGGSQDYYIVNNKIGIGETPDAADTNAIKVYYYEQYPRLHRATATSTSATSMTFPATATAGEVEAINDYYNDLEIYVISGTNAGLRGTITDYVGSTGVASVTGFATSTTDVYTFELPIPRKAHNLVCTYAMILALEFENTEPIKLASMYRRYEREFDKLYGRLKPRQKQRARFVTRLRPQDTTSNV